jgi:hypothetical protein
MLAPSPNVSPVEKSVSNGFIAIAGVHGTTGGGV